ncbi:MAG TPA: hypothetical protein VFE14_04820 [Micromonosporaceae bacterium]|nr:hypothetical protein [Micromonosporaceae bacterium]
MTRPAVQHSTTGSSFATARRHRAELLQTIQAFEAALAVPARDPRWRERVIDRLRGLSEAFGEHVVLTEGPDGLYAELLDHAPRLTRGVRVLIREHAALRDHLEVLAARAQASDTERLRRRANEVLRLLARHRQRGADLVYEAYATDIGGET